MTAWSKRVARFFLFAAAVFATAAGWAASLFETIAATQPKIVKIYGAGGFQGLQAYQTGLLISPQGHILTVWSTVLDADPVDVVLSDGRRLPAKLLGADPRLEAAVLKIDADNLPAFSLSGAPIALPGERILALSNAFNVATGNEWATVQRGTIAAKTRLAARQGVFDTPYHGPVYVLDVVTNNSGAAGGALVDREGRLLGMLGKELTNAENHTWLNYAIPAAELEKPVEAIRSGKFKPAAETPTKKPANSVQPIRLGIVLVPDVLARTPPFIDRVIPGTAAAKADLRPDDLIVLVGGRLVASCHALLNELSQIDREDPVALTVLRGQELLEVTLRIESP